MKVWDIYKMKDPLDNCIYVRIVKLLKKNNIWEYNTVPVFIDWLKYNRVILKDKDLWDLISWP